MNEQLIKFIELCLVDGIITDKERSVIFKKAKEFGVDEDECEVILDAMIIQKQQSANNNPESILHTQKWIIKSLTDEVFSSSSYFSNKHAAKFGKMLSDSDSNNWASKILDNNQWLQVDLGRIMTITAVSILGDAKHKQWVKKFDLHISEDLLNWEKFENIIGCDTGESLSIFRINEHVQGRYVKFLPKEWHKHITMRVDIEVKTNSAKYNLNTIETENNQSDLSFENNIGNSDVLTTPEFIDETEIDFKDFELNEKDPLFEAAARLVVSTQIGSTSLLQRCLKLGYNRSARLKEQLQSAGIVDDSTIGQVLIKNETELNEILISQGITGGSIKCQKSEVKLSQVVENEEGELDWQLIKFIDHFIVNSTISDEDKAIIFGRANDLGVDQKECELLIDTKINQLKQYPSPEIRINEDLDPLKRNGHLKYTFDGRVYDGFWINDHFQIGKIELRKWKWDLKGMMLIEPGYYIEYVVAGFNPDNTTDVIYSGVKYNKDGRRIAEGDFKNDLLNGKGTTFDYKGQKKEDGDFKEEKLHGYGKRYYTDGSRYEGFYQQGSIMKGKHFSSNNVIIYEGEYTNGKRNGKGILYNENGKIIYEGEFVDGKPDCNGENYDQFILDTIKLEYQNQEWKKVVNVIEDYQKKKKDLLKHSDLAKKYLWALYKNDGTEEKAYNICEAILENVDDKKCLYNIIGLVFLFIGKQREDIGILTKALKYFSQDGDYDKVNEIQNVISELSEDFRRTKEIEKQRIIEEKKRLAEDEKKKKELARKRQTEEKQKLYDEKQRLKEFEQRKKIEEMDRMIAEKQKQIEEQQLLKEREQQKKTDARKIGEHYFESSITAGGNAIFKEHIKLNDIEITWSKKTGIFSNETNTIPIKNITQVDVKTGVFGGEIKIMSRGFGFIHAQNFTKNDVQKIKELIFKVQSR